MIWQYFPSETCEQVSSESGCGCTRAWLRRSLTGVESDHDERQDDHEATCRKASAWGRKRGTDLRMKSQVKPRRIAIKLLSNVKGIDVILHGLRPVPISRWTTLPYCSRWLGIRFFSLRLHHYFPTIRRYTCNLFSWIWQ
jgi:hypothetical protein